MDMQRVETNSKKAFTLIELLIVIAIIGILAGGILVNMNSARIKARTAKSMQQLQSINSALQAYYATYGSYPISSGYQGYCSHWGADLGADWIPELKTAGIVTGPLSVDPRQEGKVACWDSDPSLIPGGSGDPGNGQYIYFSADGTGYKLLSHVPESLDVPSNLLDPSRVSGAAYWAWGYWSTVPTDYSLNY